MKTLTSHEIAIISGGAEQEKSLFQKINEKFREHVVIYSGAAIGFVLAGTVLGMYAAHTLYLVRESYKK